MQNRRRRDDIAYFFWRLTTFVFRRAWYAVSQIVTRKRGVTMPTNQSVGDLIARLHGDSLWVSDPWKGNLNVIYHPTRIEHRLQRVDTKIGDCDDYSNIWAWTTCHLPDIRRKWVCLYFYRTKEGKKEGHAIHVFEREGKLYWIDYGAALQISDQWGWAVADSVGRQATPIFGAMFEVTGVSKLGRVKLGGVETRRF